MEEILVTARKVAESLQDVPIAMSALSSAQLDASRVFDVDKLAELVPGVVTAGSDQRGYPVIRGIATRTPDAGADGAVGQYIDEVYQPRIANQLTALLDLERVEVLRGPQGTLFGRNTIAGAISYVTKKPGDTLDASAMVGGGTRDSFEARSSVSGPITETVSAGVAAMFRRNDGNIDVLNADGRKIGDDGSEDAGARLALRWQPSQALDINASAIFLDLKSGNVIDMVDGNPAGTVAPPLSGFFTPSTYVADWYDYKVGLTDPGELERKSSQLALRADWELADGITLTSLTAYQKFAMDVRMDLDLEVQPIAVDYTDQDSATFSQEVRLAGGEEVWHWNVGANYFLDDHSEVEDIDISNILPMTLFRSVDVETTSWAVFGQGYLSPVEKVTLSAGVRYSHDQRDYRMINISAPFGDDFDSALVPGWDTTPSWDDVSYTASIDYQLRPDLMIYVSHSKGYRSGGLQGRVSTVAEASVNFGPETAKQYEIGLKSRFFDQRLQLNVAAYHIDYSDIQINQASLVDFFTSDVIQNAAEAVMKGVEVEAKLDLTPQLSFELAYSYNDSHFSDYKSTDDIAGSIALVEGCDSDPAIFGCAAQDYIFDGVPFEFAPENTFLIAANYRHALASGAAIQLRAEYSWKDQYLLTPVPRSIYELPEGVLERNFMLQPSVGLLNANIGVELPGGHWNISLWGRNLTAERYAVRGSDVFAFADGTYKTFTFGDRRAFGLSVNWRH